MLQTTEGSILGQSGLKLTAKPGSYFIICTGVVKMEMINALQIKKPGQIEYIKMERPVPKKGEALLKIKYCGFCGSDIASYTGNQPFTTYPRIPGHEFSAEIIEINAGDTKTKLRPGMIVTGIPYFNCGVCYPCRNGRKNCCESNETMGVHRDGAFAEYITMPLEHIVYGKGLSPIELALVEPFSISYHAVNRGNVRPGDKVLVIGAGPIGIFAMVAAKIRGAEVYVADLLDQRLNLVKKLGCDGVINIRNEDFSSIVQEITDGSGMDVCIEAVGVPETFLNCIENVCYGGKIILIGNGKKEVTFNQSIIVKKELDIFGSRNSVNDFEPVINLIDWGMLDITQVVTNIYKFDEAMQAIDAIRNNDGSIGKVLLKFN